MRKIRHITGLAVLLTALLACRAGFGQTEVIYHIDDFKTNPTAWYQGGGVNFWGLHTSGDITSLMSYDDNAVAARVGYGVSGDNVTGMFFGPIMTVSDASGVISMQVNGGQSTGVVQVNNNLDINTRHNNGGLGFAIWNLTDSDFVRRSDGSIYTVSKTTGGGSHTFVSQEFSLAGLQGKDIMLVGIDRQASGWGWVGTGDISATTGAITMASVNPALMVQGYNFDKAAAPGVDQFMGWKEYATSVVDMNAQTVDLDVAPQGTISNFQVGVAGGSHRSAHYIDTSGLAAGKGFLACSNTSSIENPTGVLRSPTFLCQADIFEFLITGGNQATMALQLVDATTGEIIYSAKNGVSQNNMAYDFTDVSKYENMPVFLQLYDNQPGDGYGYIAVDQLRMVDFAPSDAKVAARANALTPVGLEPAGTEAVFNVYAWNTDGINDLGDMRNFLNGKTGGAGADSGLATGALKFANKTWGDADKSVVLRAETVIGVPYQGFYTFAVDANSGFAFSIDGAEIFSGEGEADPYLHTVFFEDAGLYNLSLDYFDVDGLINLELSAAVGDHETWEKTAFSSLGSLLSGTTFGFDVFADPITPFGVSPQDAGAGVPEPATWLLMLLGGAAMCVARRRR